MAQINEIRVLSYNIHHGVGMDGVLDLERIARVIQRVQPTVVALQEVDCFTRRTGQVDQADELAELTGMTAVFSPSIDYDGGKYGNAVLSRLPIVSSEQATLPGKEPRSALRVGVDGGGGFKLNLIATHFSLIRDLRWQSVPLINELAATVPGDEPIILAGDLNTIPQSETIRLLRETWEVAGYGEVMKSYPADTPREQIDYIMARPAGRLSLSSVCLSGERVASDHLPISAVFTVC